MDDKKLSSNLPMKAPARGQGDVGFIHIGAWGDLYVSTAALKEVVDEFPQSNIYLIGSQRWVDVIDSLQWPTIAGVFVCENGKTGRLFTRVSSESKGGSEAKQFEAVSGEMSLRKFLRGFQATFNIRTESFRFAWAPLFARVPRRHGSASFPWSKIFYTHAAPWLGKDPIIHERDRMIQVIEGPGRIGRLAEKWKSIGLPRLKTPDRERAARLAHAPFGRYWLINPTSSRKEKAWPADNFKLLFEKLEPVLAMKGISLRLLGAPSESEWLKSVLPSVLDSRTYIIQPPSIQELMTVLGGAQVLIANTSSVQFLGAGMGVKTITLMGRARPEIWGPLGPSDVLLRGTSDPQIETDIFKQEAEAYRSISVETVFQACKASLNG